METIIGPTQSKHFLEQRRRSIFIDYLIATSVHGLRSIGRAYSLRNRFFWIATLLIALGFSFYFIISSFLQYFAYPTNTKVDIVADLDMIFPAITICSSNPQRYDRMNISLVNYFYRTNPSNATFNQTTLNSLALGLYTDLLNRNQMAEWRGLSFQLNELLLECSYNGINCFDIFTPSISSILGNCYTFNWKTSNPLFTLNNISSLVFVPKEGLLMKFYVPRESLFPTTMFDTGLTLLVHDNDELPFPNQNGISLQPGLSHTINFRKSQTIFMAPPYTACTSEVGEDLQSLYQTTFFNMTTLSAVAYSRSVCQYLCEQAFTFSQCACILPTPFFTQHVRTLDGRLISVNICSAFSNQSLCSFFAKQEFAASDELQARWCSYCTPQCEQTDFSVEISAQAAPSDADKQYWANLLLNTPNRTNILRPTDFAQRFDHYFTRNYLKVIVSCASKQVTLYTQEAKISLIDTFSAIGGQTGLWLGLSILSLVELAEVIYRMIYKSIASWKSRRRTDNLQFMTAVKHS